MCLAAVTLQDGTQVACRECWECRADRVNDWVGRGIAEMRTAKASHAVTLTYGRDRDETKVSYGEAEHERAVILTYSDIQKFMKLLRKHGYPARYLVTGEYGSKKGRAHWHILLFWQDKVPPGIVLKQNMMFVRYDENGEVAGDFWPHGFAFFDEPGFHSFRYNLKYVLKEQGNGASEAQAKAVCSKRPPLGAEYFRRRAVRFAEERLVPADGVYTFPEAVRANGERYQFHLRGPSARMFAEAFVSAWRVIYGSEPELNEWLLTHLTGYSEKTRELQRLADIELRERVERRARPVTKAEEALLDREAGLELVEVFEGKKWHRRWRWKGEPKAYVSIDDQGNAWVNGDGKKAYLCTAEEFYVDEEGLGIPRHLWAGLLAVREAAGKGSEAG